MKHLVIAVLLALTLAGCGGGGGAATESSAAESPVAASEESSAQETTAGGTPASGCTASGLDAMTALSDFQLEMDQAQKDGKITSDQLLASRDSLFDATQAAQEKEDWAAYCKAIDDTRTELGL